MRETEEDYRISWEKPAPENTATLGLTTETLVIE
jgi:hypothetical protein